MANASLIGRMLYAVDEYDAGRMSPEQVERFIESHMEGLEQIGLGEVHESRRLCGRLVVAHWSIGEEEFLDAEQTSVVVAELRRFLQSIPGGQQVRRREGFQLGDSAPEAHIVFCETRMLLDRSQYGSWRNIQDAYHDYKASLGPWSEAEIVDFLQKDWGPDDARWPFTRRAIAEFFNSGQRLLTYQEAEPKIPPDCGGIT